jgi:hypothetical protein
VGNRTMLSFSSCCEFEANNCLPVTWLALFSPEDFVVETQREDDEEYSVAIYRTAQPTALQRAELAIDRLKGQTPAWAYLRPLEILRDELRSCPAIATIELDVTQFWAKDDAFRQKVIEGPAAFAILLDTITGDQQKDLAALDRLVDDYSIANISSVVDLDAEDRMFVLIGTYWGEREDIYSLECFDEDYWGSNL